MGNPEAFSGTKTHSNYNSPWIRYFENGENEHTVQVVLF